MVTKDEILSEILRLADENGGSPVGRSRFFTETGISESDWLGRYWTRWGDAVAEAGFRPNTLNPVGLSVEDLTASVADLTRDLGHFPTVAERKMKRRSDSGFPSHGVIEKRLGNRSELVRRLVEFAADRPGYEAVLDCCTPLMVDDTGGDEVEGEGERAEAGTSISSAWTGGISSDALRTYSVAIGRSGSLSLSVRCSFTRLRPMTLSALSGTGTTDLGTGGPMVNGSL